MCVNTVCCVYTVAFFRPRVVSLVYSVPFRMIHLLLEYINSAPSASLLK